MRGTAQLHACCVEGSRRGMPAMSNILLFFKGRLVLSPREHKHRRQARELQALSH